MIVNQILKELNKLNHSSLVLLKHNETEKYWGELGSYRGYYQELAVETGSKIVNVLGVIEALTAAKGKKYTGYKGGEYKMGGHTDLYWAEYGELGPIVEKIYYRMGEVIIEFVDEEEE